MQHPRLLGKGDEGIWQPDLKAGGETTPMGILHAAHAEEPKKTNQT